MRTPAGSRRRMAISFSLREQRNLDAVDLVGVGGDDIEADVHRRLVVGWPQ